MKKLSNRIVNEKGGNIMKKEVFKVFVLGLIGLTLFTGCNKKESVKKLKKNHIML